MLNWLFSIVEVWAGRLAWLGHRPYEAKVAGSSPARPTNFWVRAYKFYKSSSLREKIEDEEKDSVED